MTRVNIQLPEELHQKLRIQAIQQETTIKEFVINLLEKEV